MGKVVFPGWAEFPTFTVACMERAVAWYVNVLGCQLVPTAGYCSGGPTAHLVWENHQHLLLLLRGTTPGPCESILQRVRLHLWYQGNLHTFARNLTISGGKVQAGPILRPCGVRELSLHDPDDHTVLICQEVRSVAEGCLSGITAEGIA